MVNACRKDEFKRARVETASLAAARRAAAEHGPHQHAEIEPAGVHEQPLEDVPMPAQMRAAQPTGVVEMREGALDRFAASPHELATADTAHATTIVVDDPWASGAVVHRRRPRSGSAM